jgi:RNA polymerase sigma factor (sigma-70 family)
MPSPGAITLLLQNMKQGDRDAVEQLWERYFDRLVSLARSKLLGVPRQMADEEDVALSAMKSFCRAVEENRFPKLENSGDLWQILVMLTRNKAANLREYHTSQKRNASLEVHDAEGFFDLLQGEEPDPQFVVELKDQFQSLLDGLPDSQLQKIAILKMEGYTHTEIAEKLGVALITIDRRVKRIRDCWGKSLQG